MIIYSSSICNGIKTLNNHTVLQWTDGELNTSKPTQSHPTIKGLFIHNKNTTEGCLLHENNHDSIHMQGYKLIKNGINTQIYVGAKN